MLQLDETTWVNPAHIVWAKDDRSTPGHERLSIVYVTGEHLDYHGASRSILLHYFGSAAARALSLPVLIKGDAV